MGADQPEEAVRRLIGELLRQEGGVRAEPPAPLGDDYRIEQSVLRLEATEINITINIIVHGGAGQGSGGGHGGGGGGPSPGWYAVIGAVILVATILMLLFIVVWGPPIGDGKRMPFNALVAFGLAAATFFLGGSAHASGKIPLPRGRSLISVTLTEGVAVFFLAIIVLSVLHR
jgi:hypothetical protein